MRVPVPECFAVIDFLKPLRALHQCREHGRGLAVVDAPRRALAARSRDEGVAVLVLPVRVCRRLLHIRLATLCVILHGCVILHFADRMGDKSRRTTLRYTSRLPYGMADRTAVRLSHNAANGLGFTLPRQTISRHSSRMQGVLHGAVLHGSRNAANERIAPISTSYDLACIPDILKGNALPRAHNTADIRARIDFPCIVGIADHAVLRRPHNAAEIIRSTERAAKGDIPNGSPLCSPHNAADMSIPPHIAVHDGEILDERPFDIAKQPDIAVFVSLLSIDVKMLYPVSDAVESSCKLRTAAAIAANRFESLYDVYPLIPSTCFARIDVVREHISAAQIRFDMLQFVDIVHAHIVIVCMRLAVEVLNNPSARFCRCLAMVGNRARIVGDLIRRRGAAHLDVLRYLIPDIVADMRYLRAADGDCAARERRAVCVRHSIRIEDGDVLALDVEFACLYRAKVQHVAHLRARGERARAVCLERLRRYGNVSGIRRREAECARIDLRILSEENAVRVDEVDVPAALDRAVDVRRALARDEVQIVACLCAAVEAHLLVLLDGEVLPAEDIVLGLARDVHDRAARGDIRLPRIRRGIRALDGQRIRVRRGKGGGNHACKERTEDGAAQLLLRC